MILSNDPPPHWNRFVSLIQAAVPHFPVRAQKTNCNAIARRRAGPSRCFPHCSTGSADRCRLAPAIW
jgi:hypothetical protein